MEVIKALVKNIFGLNRCWMCGDENNRCIFAAMGLTTKCISSKHIKTVNQHGISKNRSWDKLPDPSYFYSFSSRAWNSYLQYNNFYQNELPFLLS